MLQIGTVEPIQTDELCIELYRKYYALHGFPTALWLHDEPHSLAKSFENVEEAHRHTPL
jgi:hypothetical protein